MIPYPVSWCMVGLVITRIHVSPSLISPSLGAAIDYPLANAYLNGNWFQTVDDFRVENCIFQLHELLEDLLWTFDPFFVDLSPTLAGIPSFFLSWNSFRENPSRSSQQLHRPRCFSCPCPCRSCCARGARLQRCQDVRCFLLNVTITNAALT